MSIHRASEKLGIKYATARDIMSWYTKHGRLYHSAWDEFKIKRSSVLLDTDDGEKVTSKEPRQLIVTIEVPEGA